MRQSIKKMLKEPDFFQRYVAHILERMRSRRRETLFAIVGTVAVLFLVYLFVWMGERRERQALALFETADALYQDYREQRAQAIPEATADTSPDAASASLDAPASGDPADAKLAAQRNAVEAKLNTLVQDYSSTSAGALARYYLGEIAFAEKNFEAAIDHYQKYLDALPRRSSYRAIILSNIGYAWEGLQQWAKAAASFVRAGETGGNPLADRAFFNAARNFDRLDDKTSAAKWYQRIVDDTPDSSLVPIARSRARTLAVANP